MTGKEFFLKKRGRQPQPASQHFVITTILITWTVCNLPIRTVAIMSLKYRLDTA